MIKSLKFHQFRPAWQPALALVTILWALPLAAFADFLGTLSELVGYVIWLILIGPQLVLLQLELWLLPVIASYNGFTGVAGVVTGWGIMRDVANMFFVLILLIIAFATIMNIERYGYRALLKRLLIMAILVNFSMTIVGLLIDLSQVVMLSFVAAIKDVASGNIVVGFGLVDAFNLRIETGGVQDLADYITTLLLGAVMITVVVAVVGIFILILALRIVKLWIIIVMAPLAFLFHAFPRTEGYYSEWVKELTNNLIIGPVLAFFLWLSFTIIGRGDVHKQFIKEGTDDEAVTANLGKITSGSNITNFIIALAMLIGGLQQAARTGGAGASFAATGAARIKAGMQSRLRRVSRPVLGGAAKIGGLAGAGLAGLTRLPSRMPRVARPGSRLAKVEGAARKVVGAPLGAVGFAIRRAAATPLEKLGLQAKGTARGFAAQGIKEEEEAVKGLTPAGRERYLAAKTGPFLGADAKTLLIRRRFEEGYYKDKSAEETDADQKYLQRHGGVAESDTAYKMRTSDAALASEEDLARSIRDRGAKATFENMKWDNALDAVTGALRTDSNGQLAMEKMFEKLDAKGRKAIYDSKDKKDQETMVKAIKDFAAKNADINKVVTADGKVDKDSVHYKTAQTLLHLDSKAFAPFFARLEEGQRELFLKEAAPGYEGKDMAKLDMAKPEEERLFVGLSKVISTGQRTDFLSASGGKNDPKVKAMVRAQVQQGDIKVNIDNAITEEHVDPAEIEKYFQDAVTNRDATKFTEADIRKKLAIKNLEHAHLVFKSQPEELVEFAKNLKKEQLLKMDTNTLKTKIIPFLDESMQKVMANEGLWNIEKAEPIKETKPATETKPRNKAQPKTESEGPPPTSP